MSHSFVILALFLGFILKKTGAEISSLQDPNTNQDQLDPLNDQDQDLTINNQDKRTLCAVFNKCSGGSITAAVPVKHIIVKPVRHVVGYAQVVRPVVRPVLVGGYKYPKPKIHFKLKAPSAIKPVIGGWTPISTKPFVVKPASHVDVIHPSPVPHVDHVYTTPAAIAAPVHVDHVHVQPSPVPVKPVHPIVVQGAHVDQVHQISVPHGNHYDTFTHVDHIHQTPVPVAQPVVPVAPPPTVVRPVAPPPVLFEVTRPNLGVLPLGARFPHPILREVPHVHLRPVLPVAPLPVAPAVPVASPIPVAPPAVLAPRPVIPTPVGLPHIIPQPGFSVEYHGTRNYLPISGGVPLLPQTPVSAVAPTGFGITAPYPHQYLPFEHAHHGFLTQQQQLPHDHQAQFRPEHQLPQNISPHFLQNQIQTAQQYQEIPQGQLPLEGERNLDQFFQSNQESFAPNIQSFTQSNVIQPGQTDLQIPYHLPQHPGWESTFGIQQQPTGFQEESRGFVNEVFRPSQQLETPYQK